MERPSEFPWGRILVLAPGDSFNASYIKRSLESFGVPVLHREGSPVEVFAALTGEDWASISGCIAVDVGPALFADIAQNARKVPCLFAGYHAGGWFPGPYAWMCPPFASYQVVETYLAMLTGTVSAAAKP
jgi:hypothetical protein